MADGRDDRAAEALVPALDDDDPMVAQFAASSLATIGGDAVEEVLLGALDDPGSTEEARAMGVFALGKIGSDRARERIDDLVDEAESEAVRKRAFAALSRLGGR